MENENSERNILHTHERAEHKGKMGDGTAKREMRDCEMTRFDLELRSSTTISSGPSSRKTKEKQQPNIGNQKWNQENGSKRQKNSSWTRLETHRAITQKLMTEHPKRAPKRKCKRTPKSNKKPKSKNRFTWFESTACPGDTAPQHYPRCPGTTSGYAPRRLGTPRAGAQRCGTSSGFGVSL